MKKIYSTLCCLLILLAFASCSDNDSNPAVGPITLEFDNIVGTSDLELNTANTPYTNSKEEAYKVTRLQYYVSHIKLKKSDGTIFEDEIKSDGSKGYYLVDEADAESQEITLENVPAGDYIEATFTIGVDASQIDHNNQTGALNTDHGLFLDWNFGYVFMALEGVSPASTETDHVFQYHVGGYKDDAETNQVNNIRTITLSFGDKSAPVRAEHEPEVHLLFDVNKFLNGSGEQVSFATNAKRDSPEACEPLADNIATSFVVDHIHTN